MEWILLAVGFVVGIGGNLVASFAWEKIDSARTTRKFGELKLAGNWAEHIPDSTGREFSLATVDYSRSKKIYFLNGTNYRNDGNPFCHWRTVASYLDLENQVFHYVFATTNVGNLNISSYGYGVLNLVRRDGKVEPEDGYYVYVDSAGLAVSVSHTFRRVDSLPTSRTENAGALIDSIFPGLRIP